MAVVELGNDTFEQTINSKDFVIVDFWAPWCGPCRSFAPVFEKVSADFPDIVFAKVNTEEEQSYPFHPHPDGISRTGHHLCRGRCLA